MKISQIYINYYCICMQRNFICETAEHLDTDFHKKFVLLVAEQGLNSPTDEEWQEIMVENSRSVYVMHLYMCTYGWQAKGKGGGGGGEGGRKNIN